MRYLSKGFWRMIIGLVVVLVMGVAFLTLCQLYGTKNVNLENYVAGSKGE
ncbi:MAG: hypothetical protein WC385_03250 [Candidatus Paceibacterota bacterium]|jgi:hypothetical protein